MWRHSNDPPESNYGRWSQPVIVITNYGNVYLISYFGNSEEGVWQRPESFKKGEEVDLWIAKPLPSNRQGVIMRFQWNEYFMLLAKIASLRSGCNSRPTGAIIVKNKRIISTGYNGTLPGKKQCTDFGPEYCYRRSTGIQDTGEDKYRDCPSIHAEANALDQLLKYGPSLLNHMGTYDVAIYCTLFPCIHCLKRIASAGIKKIFYEFEYKSDDLERDKSWRKKASEWGITATQLNLDKKSFLQIHETIFKTTSQRRLK